MYVRHISHEFDRRCLDIKYVFISYLLVCISNFATNRIINMDIHTLCQSAVLSWCYVMFSSQLRKHLYKKVVPMIWDNFLRQNGVHKLAD